MNKSERDDQIEEMVRLYLEEHKTLQEIGDFFNLTKAAVSKRFQKRGVKLITARPPKAVKVCDKEILIRLYITERRLISEIANQLNVSERIVTRELKRHHIKIRSRGELLKKTPDFVHLEIGEMTVLPNAWRHKAGSYYYNKAKLAGIKISTKRIGQQDLQITRIK